jgi:alkylation response protein AidB-like acyl-CoA dehydrogenase
MLHPNSSHKGCNYKVSKLTMRAKRMSDNSMIGLAVELAATFGERAERHERENSFPFENYEDLRECSYVLATVPESSGGWGESIGTVTRAQAVLGEGCGSTALVTSMHLAQVARLQFAGWQPAQVQSVLQNIVEHGYLINSVQSEPLTGSPSRGGVPGTTATPTNDGYRLNGRKTYTTGAPVLHYMVVTAALPGADGKPEIGQFLIEKTLPGVTIDPTWNAMAMRLTGSHDLVLENVRVPKENLLAVGKKLSPANAALNAAGGLPVAAIYHGIGRAAAKFAAAYARERRPNSIDSSIATLPHIQEKAGRMELALLAAENTLFATADLADRGEHERNPTRLNALVGAAKQLATNNAITAIDLALRIVGSAGLSMNLPLQRYYRDVRAGLGNPPMDDVSTTMLGKLALGLL